MNATIVAFLVSFLTCFGIIRYQHLHRHITSDHLEGPQKFHTRITPRIGGIAILISMFLACAVNSFFQTANTKVYFLLLLCSLPVFGFGLLEDLSKRIGITIRLIAAVISAALACLLLNNWIMKVDVPWLDLALNIPVISVVFTCFAIAGLTNAINIIDGFNGLAGAVALLSLLAIGYVGIRVHDLTIALIAFNLAGALTGFLFWNYPRGLIFLGDGGAYLIGFLIASLSILLTNQHPEVSPWFALLVSYYPIFETLFSIWRRFIHQGKSPGQPDGTHFHSLIYRRLIKNSYLFENVDHQANAKTSPYLWILACCAIIPAVLWWHITVLLQLSSLVFGVLYVYLYISIVRFKTPHWLK